MDFEAWLSEVALLDLELAGDRLTAAGALYRGQTFRAAGVEVDAKALRRLEAFLAAAPLIAGHNLVAHDLPQLRARAPGLALLERPVVDTLWVSPLAFPQNPYHHLVKDYKLVRDSLNDPVADARLAGRLLADEGVALGQRHAADPGLVAFHRFAFTRPVLGSAAAGLERFFDAVGAEAFADAGAALEEFERRAARHACRSAARQIAIEWERRADLRPLAYALSWLEVAGRNSVLPPWTRVQFPELGPLLRELRDRPCGQADCAYCAATHDPRGQLQRFFGFDVFRAEPAAPDGSSLQEAIVRAGMREEPLLAILPTGAGKSLCYQLPALVRNLRRGVLTVVISPLQALMKDQVDNLRARSGTPGAAALSGLLTPIERADVLSGVRLGDVAILYVSPEQLRNRSFREALRQRELGCWVFDEAHCLSKWGHDFRPDYLYAARFIREFARGQGVAPSPVACFTATAKPDVIDEILGYFHRELGQRLKVFRSDAARENLRFEVQTLAGTSKWKRVAELLEERLSGPGSAVVYAATRSGAEQLAEFLRAQGVTAAAFHAGLNPPEKRRIQDDFVAGRTPVVCATNAFGMGIDKDNVRLVIHADIPGSLENYLQEAGRAGRDQAPADCILLYNEQDIETQFRLAATARLSSRDLAAILRGLRRARRGDRDEVVLTAGELLRDETVEVGFDTGARDADTRVRTAVALLERGGFIERNENHTRVFQGRPRVRSLAEAEQRIDRLKLSARRRRQWLAVLQTLLEAGPDEGVSADDLAGSDAFREEPDPGEALREAPKPYGQAVVESSTLRVLRVLYDMVEAGLLRQDLMMTAFVRHKVAHSSAETFRCVCALEEDLWETLQEAEPDPEGWLPLHLRRLNQRLLDAGHHCAPEILMTLLRGLTGDGRSFGDGSVGFDLQPVSRDCCRARVRGGWRAVRDLAERRRALARLALDTVLGHVPADTAPGTDLLVEFAADEILHAFRSDLALGGQVRDAQVALQQALLFLHENRVLILQKGLAVFRQAMTIRLLPESRGRRFTHGDYSPLAQHYQERTFQVHVMNEYARLGLERLRSALALVAAYFTLDRKSFVERYFEQRRELITRATSADSYHRIVDHLGNPVQVAVVAAAPGANGLILAGPGAGKTRTVVHRVAYLLRVERVPARGVVVLCFNRHAALELRRRLHALVGDDARGLTVQTYHGLALRLLGWSLAERAERTGDTPVDFRAMLTNATALLRGQVDLPGLAPDEWRDRLLRGCSHILVDEYQDIDQPQYELVSALAGRTEPDAERRLAILAVGDDDQNIYGFRQTSNEFIRRFQEDYKARIHYLVENYRSTAHIIAAANQVIARNADRLKADHPIRINAARRRDPPGGRWSALDPVAGGRVLILGVKDALDQAAAVLGEIDRRRSLDPGLEWGRVAVLARTGEELAPLRALAEARQVPLVWQGYRDRFPPLHRVREVAGFLEALAQRRADIVKPDELARALPPESKNAWTRLLHDLWAEYREEAGDAEAPAADALEFLYDALHEARRDAAGGSGLWLGTVHAAKGLEFPHVFVLGGGWPVRRSRPEADEERRVFYVGMTRAIETLTLFERADQPHAFLAALEGEHVLRRRAPPTPLVDLDLARRRFELLTLEDLFLDWAGQTREATVQERLAQLETGDSLRVEVKREQLWLCNAAGAPVAHFSAAGANRWRTRLEQVQAWRVFAVIRRRAEDVNEPRFRRALAQARWEIPLPEAVLRG